MARTVLENYKSTSFMLSPEHIDMLNDIARVRYRGVSRADAIRFLIEDEFKKIRKKVAGYKKSRELGKKFSKDKEMKEEHEKEEIQEMDKVEEIFRH